MLTFRPGSIKILDFGGRPLKKWWKKPDPECTCNRPVMVSLRPGEVFHLCRIHPDRVIVGSQGPQL